MPSSEGPTPRWAGERRRAARRRTLLAGQISYGDRGLTTACGVRNLSATGALVALPTSVLLAEPVYLLLAREGLAYEVSIMWRQGLQLGLSLGARHDMTGPVAPPLRQLQAIWKEMAPR